jgi:hypothetical protein
MAWYVELPGFPFSVTPLNCGFTVMKFSGYRPFLTRPPATPVMALVLARVCANWPTLPFANKDLKMVLLRSDADPVTVVPLITPEPRFRPLSIESNSTALPPFRVAMNASRIPFSKIFAMFTGIPPKSFVPLLPI